MKFPFFRSEKKQNLLKLDIPFYETNFPTLDDMTPSTIRTIIKSRDNVRIQDMIDLLIRVDSHFGGKIQDRLSIVKKAKFTWTPASESSADVNVMEKTKEVIEPLITTKILKHLLNAIFRRFSVAEIIWDIQGSMLIPVELVKLPFRGFDLSTYEYDFSLKKDFALRLYDPNSGKYEAIPENKTIQCFSSIEFDQEIISISEIIAIMIVIKYYALQKDWPRFNELFGLPMRLGIYEKGASKADIDYLNNALINLGSDAAGVIGGLTKIDFVQPKNNSPEMFERIIRTCNDEISKAITGQSATSESGKESSYASMKILNGIREDIAADSLDLLSDALNEFLIWPFVSLNFNVKNPPLFRLVLPTDLHGFADLDQKLKNLGVKFKKEYFINRYRLQEDEFEIEESQPQIPFPQMNFQTSTKKKTLEFPHGTPFL